MTANTAATDPRSPARPAGAELYSRLLAAFLLPFLAAAFILLYLLPGTTEALFALTIEPPLTAMFLASAYLGGIWFFAAAARAHNWRAVNRGIPAVLVFATLLLIATLLHLDKFHPGHISFIVWFALYLTTPALVVILMIVNRHTDDGTDAPRDYRVPLPTRIVLAAIGVASLATGLALFFQADALIAAWPWTLTPLTAQVMGAALTLPGIVNLALLRDPRWSAFRTVFQAQIVSLVAIVLALIIRADDLKPAPSSLVFCAGIGLSLVAYILFTSTTSAAAAAAAAAARRRNRGRPHKTTPRRNARPSGEGASDGASSCCADRSGSTGAAVQGATVATPDVCAECVAGRAASRP